MPTPAEFLRDVIDPGLAWLAQLGGPPPSDAARRMLLAIALQESGPALEARYQNHPSATNAGAAKSHWQFEQGGGVRGVMNHAATRLHAQNATKAANVHHHEAAVWRAMEGHDNLAVAFARLLLWSSPRAMPATQQAGWDEYIAQWRPGRPHADRWPANWAAADAAVKASPWRT